MDHFCGLTVAVIGSLEKNESQGVTRGEYAFYNPDFKYKSLEA